MRAFISYSHKDKHYLDRLKVHLVQLQRDGLISTFHDNEILAGDNLDHKISEEIDNSDLFLLLVSPDFIASGYCYDVELKSEIKKQQAGEARVVSIIVEPCDWQSIPSISKLKVLPKDGKPISEWQNENSAYLDIANELRRVANDFGFQTKIEKQTSLNHSDEKGASNAPMFNNVRVPKQFSEIDKARFVDKGFLEISQYFKKAIPEISTVDGLDGLFRDIDANTFTCMLENSHAVRRAHHLTVRQSGDQFGLGDITYSFQEHSHGHSANGSFNVSHDEYELFFEPGIMGILSPNRQSEKAHLVASDVAELIWEEFMKNAGISYA